MGEQRTYRGVRNADILVLSKVRYYMAQIESLEERTSWQRLRLKRMTQQFSAAPGGGGSKRGMDEGIAQISELESKHELLLKAYARQVKKAEAALCHIESEQLRAMVRLLYMDGLPDSMVQNHLRMSRHTFEKARRAVEEASSMAEVRWKDRYQKDAPL